MELYTGRPENIEDRLSREAGVYDLLDSLGIEYKRVYGSKYRECMYLMED